MQLNLVRIMTQILDIVCLQSNIHPLSFDFFRQLQRWIGNIDWNCQLVTCQLPKNIDQWLVPSMWSIFLANWHVTSQLAIDLSHVNWQGILITCQLTCDKSTTPINTINPSLQLPEEIQWDWTKICKLANYVQYLICNSYLILRLDDWQYTLWQ